MIPLAKIVSMITRSKQCNATNARIAAITILKVFVMLRVQLGRSLMNSKVIIQSVFAILIVRAIFKYLSIINKNLNLVSLSALKILRQML